MARLLLLRHAQSEWNAKGLWQGQADPPLTAHGEEQAKAAGLWLVGHGFTGVVSSPQRRALRTAQILAEVLGLPDPEVDDDLRERAVGDWSGKSRDEIERLWPGQMDAWRNGELDRPSANGEPNAEFNARVTRVLDKLAGRPEDQTLLVVTHGGVVHTVGATLGSTWRGILNLHGAWVEHGPVAGLQVRPPEGDEMAAVETVVL